MDQRTIDNAAALVEVWKVEDRNAYRVQRRDGTGPVVTLDRRTVEDEIARLTGKRAVHYEAGALRLIAVMGLQRIIRQEQREEASARLMGRE